MSSSRHELRDRRNQLFPGHMPRIHLRHGEFIADIIVDRRSLRPLWFCIVQRQGSPEVLFLGQFDSQAEAEAAGEQWMTELQLGADGRPGRQHKAVNQSSGTE